MSQMSSFFLAFLAFSYTTVFADVYLHSPRGCNNRLDEQNRERANGNRICDTQNNNRGGYNVGKMVYYKGEKIPLDWTNQHGTSKYQMENSEFIVQYMCSPLIRDGTTTRTIPIKATECYNYDCDTDVRFGRHESLDHYQMCQKTTRNEGLLTINQNLRGQAAKYTRQNPQGTRHAYECPEERDYYPYWRPSPWIDALIVTADPERCAGYQAESQNVKARGECRMPDAFFDAGGTLPNNFYYSIDEAECVTQTLTTTDENGAQTTHTAEWNIIPAHGVDAPACELVAQTRANHLGNPGGRTLYGTTWTIPETIEAGSQCVMRLRYNITTADYQAWETGASMTPGLNATFNSEKNNPNPGNDPAEYAIWEEYGLTRDDVEGSFNNNDDDSREYVLKNNPQVDAFGELLTGKFANNAPTEIKMQLAINTAQFGRTFQDRTHYFIVEDRPVDVPAEAVIKLQTVRGKRGNIVQTFPATEYFFHPETQWVRQNEYVHFAFTGSNTNPNNNDGQGKQGTDRSNFVAQRVDQYDTTEYSNFEWDMSWDEGLRDQGSAMVSYPGYVKQPDGYEIPDFLQPELNEQSFGGIDEKYRVMLATGRMMLGDHGNMEELDDASTSYNLPPLKMNTVGCTNYLCTRNNNFSNRAQKGKFCVAEGDVGEVMVAAGGAEFWDAYESSSVTWWPNSVNGQERAHVIVKYEEDTAVVSITDVNLVGTMTVGAAFVPKSLNTAKLMWQAECDNKATSCNNAWVEVPYETMMVNGASVATADVTNTGTYKVIHEPNPGPILALTVACLAFVGAISWVLINKCGDRCPKRLHFLRWENMRKGKNVDAKNASIQATNAKVPPPFTGGGKTEI